MKNIDLRINKGEVVAIVGPSGAGKSTLVDLIPRFYDVIEGAIKVDGVDVRDCNSRSLRDLIGIVDQETILFNDSIKNNITYGSQQYGLAEVEEAAKAANAYNFVQGMPEKFDTIIGDRGVKTFRGSEAEALYRQGAD